MGRRSLCFDFVGAGAGTSAGIGVLDVSVRPDKEGTLIADMESGSNGFLEFPSNRVSSCVLTNFRTGRRRRWCWRCSRAVAGRMGSERMFSSAATNFCTLPDYQEARGMR